MTLILASSSPRRRELLARSGIRFEAVPADIDETVLAGEAPDAYVARLARGKAGTVRARHPGAWILGADTTVVDAGAILGKPDDDADCARMLQRLSGRSHTVLTATCLLGPAGEVAARVCTTEVEFRALPADEIASYVASGDWHGKAGGYGAQGKAGAFILAFRGSFTNVIGLPLAEVLEDLARLGVARPDYR